MAEGFLDFLAKGLAMAAAVECSKDENGKPDPYMAAGMMCGANPDMSPEDLARLGAILGEHGAFDDDEPDV